MAVRILTPIPERAEVQGQAGAYPFYACLECTLINVAIFRRNRRFGKSHDTRALTGVSEQLPAIPVSEQRSFKMLQRRALNRGRLWAVYVCGVLTLQRRSIQCIYISFPTSPMDPITIRSF